LNRQRAKRTEAQQSRAGRPVALSGPGEAARRPFAPWAAAVGFLLLLGGYLVWFFGCDLAAGVPRTRALALLLVPDQWIAEWFGGGAAELGWSDRLPVLAAALGIWLTAFGVGRLVLRLLQVAAYLTRLEHAVLALAVGLSGISTGTLILGVAGLLHARYLFWLAAVTLVAVELALSVRSWKLRDGPPIATGRESRSAGHLWRHLPAWSVAAALVAALLLGAMLPPVDFDVLEYHLQVPKQWYEQGQITFLPHNVYGNMPLGAELLATTAMASLGVPSAWWWGALAGKLLIAGFMPLTALALYSIGTRYFSVRAGAIAGLLYLSIRLITDISVNGLNDAVLACYGLLAIFAFRLWWDEQQVAAESRAGLAAMAGVLAGATAACKYTGIVLFLLPLTLALVFAMVFALRRHRFRTLAAFLLMAIASSGLWYGKNWVLAGNPTYPVGYRTFGGATWTAAKDAQWRQAHAVPRDAQGRRYSLAQLWHAVLEVGGRAWGSHPLLVPFGLLLVLRWRCWRRWLFWLLAAAGLFCAEYIVPGRGQSLFCRVRPVARQPRAVPCGADPSLSESIGQRRRAGIAGRRCSRVLLARTHPLQYMFRHLHSGTVGAGTLG